MTTTLIWRDLRLGRSVVPASEVNVGEYVRLVIDFKCQYNFIHQLFAIDDCPDEGECRIWLQTDDARYDAAT